MSERISIEEAIAALKTATPEEIQPFATELAALAERARPQIEGALAGPPNVGPVEAEALAAQSPETATTLIRYKQEYDHLPADAKGRLTWEAVSAKLLANEGAKLKKANAMQGGGHLFHITENGDVLFKDKSVEPVMYGWDKPEGEKDRRLVQIYGRVPDLMAKIKQWANAPEIEARVTADGYELFEDDGNYGFSEEMKRAASANEGGLFVASDNRQEWRDTVLKNGRRAVFDPYNESVRVDGIVPAGRGDDRGAVRLLRV